MTPTRAQPTPDAGTSDCAVDDALFVGNSYTAFNDLAMLTAGFATASGCAVRFESINPGGARFSTHAGNAGTLDRIRTGGWDAVVLQNQSQVPGFRPADVRAMSLPHAVTLANTAREADPDPRVVYFVTWGRRDGDADNCGYYPLVCTFEGHTQALAEGYAMYATETMGELSPAGAAWALVRGDAARPFDETALWSGDGSHPSLRGSYLTAAVMHYVLQGESPVGSSFDGGLDAADAAYLQDMAARAVDAL